MKDISQHFTVILHSVSSTYLVPTIGSLRAPVRGVLVTRGSAAWACGTCRGGTVPAAGRAGGGGLHVAFH